ncbi:Dps family protein [Sunxiuqinia elliptica]|uniref:Starvation-inducible DNA-binding protein n=1 Tax=Sunxiuqinia elliptica TaxID=655355 RepID=A0A4R6H4X2_9BACT|nr:DNA starvation/stationary phase protection protein [Sunxiuqinia elliptica]TDO03202.1 starvation-inducible DNA-binding protein [Sunxiuqinia elliptica]TDO59399.1 starvation-inducible DNA-binding protein [Sunxiuqinia elliptica]
MKTQEQTQAANQVLVEKMNAFLADLQVHYQNLRGFHWNVEGSLFFVLHAKFEEFYNEASETADEVAERILMLGGQPLHSFSQYLQVAEIQEVTDLRDGKEAVQTVIDQSEILLRKMNELLELAGDQNDEATTSLFSDQISSTEKRLWMLKTFLR